LQKKHKFFLKGKLIVANFISFLFDYFTIVNDIKSLNANYISAIFKLDRFIIMATVSQINVIEMFSNSVRQLTQS